MTDTSDNTQRSSKDVARSLRELAADLPKKPVHLGLLQQALCGGAAEIEQLRAQVEGQQRTIQQAQAAYRQGVGDALGNKAHAGETRVSRTDRAENLAKALEHYLKAHDTLSAVQDTDEVSGTNEASDCGLHDVANDAWRAMRTALYEYRKNTMKARVCPSVTGRHIPSAADDGSCISCGATLSEQP